MFTVEKVLSFLPEVLCYKPACLLRDWVLSISSSSIYTNFFLCYFTGWRGFKQLVAFSVLNNGANSHPAYLFNDSSITSFLFKLKHFEKKKQKRDLELPFVSPHLTCNHAAC